jgi:SAM-dependent methyltransferase
MKWSDAKSLMEQMAEQVYFKRDFWSKENLKYVEPHFRLEKSARLVNRIARGRKCEFLDVGCGPATLSHLLDKNIEYHGIDIAIHNPAPNLIQTDFMENPIAFQNKRFDIVLAQGVFEYSGALQSQKFGEIKDILNENGTFFLSYVNFDHLNIARYHVYNNMQPFNIFKQSLRQFFTISQIIPTSHHWHHREPTRRIMKALQMRTKANIPLFSRLFAIEYFVICFPLGSKRKGTGHGGQLLPE